MTQQSALTHNTIPWLSGTMTVTGKRLVINLVCNKCQLNWIYQRFCGNPGHIAQKAMNMFGLDHAACDKK